MGGAKKNSALAPPGGNCYQFIPTMVSKGKNKVGYCNTATSEIVVHVWKKSFLKNCKFFFYFFTELDLSELNY
jgi:hypothetical protein